jgi:hypothetical protein
MEITIELRFFEGFQGIFLATVSQIHSSAFQWHPDSARPEAFGHNAGTMTILSMFNNPREKFRAHNDFAVSSWDRIGLATPLRFSLSQSVGLRAKGHFAQKCDVPSKIKNL